MAAGKMCSRKGKAETAEVCLICVIQSQLSLNILIYLFWVNLFKCGPPRPVALPVYRGKLRHRVWLQSHDKKISSICVTAFVFMSEVDRIVPEWTENRTGLPCVCQEDDGGGCLLHHLSQGDFSRGGLQIKISGRWNTVTASCYDGR